MSDERKAVFLSYASQDAEAARRIADALRAAGIEVWFDQSELRGGDAWDAKIRKQIKECALFVPVISASTQARLEGYFRLEWKLAEDRSHLMAKGRPFIVPVSIDDTKDWDAQVPDAFMVVQWTRLPGGAASHGFCERIKHLLAGAERSGAREPLAGFAGRGAESQAGRRAAAMTWRIAWCAAAIAAAVLAFWRPWRALGGGAPASRAAVPPEAEQLTARALAIYAGVHSRPELEMAEQMARRGTELAPLSARAWAVRAGVEANYIFREFASGQAALEHARNAEEFANRALALNREEVEALWALGETAAFQHAAAQAESFYRRVFALDPRHNRARRSLTWVLRDADRLPEALAVMQEAIRIDPADVLSRYDLAYVYKRGWDFPRAATELDAVLAARPFSSALITRAGLAAKWKGDLAAMRAALDRLDSLDRGDDGAVFMAMWCGLLERHPERVLEAAGRTTRAYLEHPDFSGPKAWLPALAQQLAGRSVAAREQWAAAETVLRERLRNDGGNQVLRVQLATTLAWLGGADEAAREIEPVEAAWREDLTPARAKRLAAYYAAAGDAARAIPLLRRMLHGGNGMIGLTVPLLELDPWWDKLRGAPEFRALLTNPPPMPALLRAAPAPPNASAASSGAPGAPDAAKPETKSIAVLAFENLSDDKANEYFSDGISEELINALGRVPGLTVKGRTSAFYFKGNNKVSSAEIAQQLGVAYLVRGGVRKTGDKVRITAQLTRAATDDLVWSSEPFDRKLEDTIAVQEEIAGLIAQYLQLKLEVGSRAKKKVNPAAHQLVLEGRHHWNQRSEQSLALAENAFRQALALAPEFAEAHAGMADVHQVRLTNLMNAGEERKAMEIVQHARQSARRATEIDPTLAEPYATLGYATFYDGSLREAAALLQRSLALNPNLAVARRYYVPVLSAQGRIDLAIEEARRAVEIDPLSMMNGAVHARTLSHAQRYAEAEVAAARAQRLQTDAGPWTRWSRTVSLWNLDRRAEALEEARSILRAVSHSDVRGAGDAEAMWVLRAGGFHDEVALHLKNLETRLAPDSYLRGFSLLAAGRTDEAWPYLQRMTRGNTLNFPLYSVIFDAVREEPRFRQLIESLGCSEEYKLARSTLAQMKAEQPMRE